MDSTPLNKALQRVPNWMLMLKDILPQLQNVKIPSSINLKDGFFHLTLDHQLSLLTTTETPFGRHHWLRLPFGVSPAPEIFQPRLHTTLSGLKSVACMADDVVSFGAGETEAEAILDHNMNLRALLNRCRQNGIELNKDKLN
jgi:hypothetical protein